MRESDDIAKEKKKCIKEVAMLLNCGKEIQRGKVPIGSLTRPRQIDGVVYDVVNLPDEIATDREREKVWRRCQHDHYKNDPNNDSVF